MQSWNENNQQTKIQNNTSGAEHSKKAPLDKMQFQEVRLSFRNYVRWQYSIPTIMFHSKWNAIYLDFSTESDCNINCTEIFVMRKLWTRLN